MKTSFVVCLLSLSLAFTSLAQSPAAPQNPPGAGAPAAAGPGAAAATSPGAAMSPGAPAAMSPGAPTQVGSVPPGQSPAAAAPATTAALSPAAESPPPAPEAAPSGGILGSNWLIDKFRKGGPIMWPILIVSIIGLTVLIERMFWLSGRWFRRGPDRIGSVF